MKKGIISIIKKMQTPLQDNNISYRSFPDNK